MMLGLLGALIALMFAGALIGLGVWLLRGHR